MKTRTRKRTKRKLLTLLLSLSMLLCYMPQVAVATTEDTGSASVAGANTVTFPTTKWSENYDNDFYEKLNSNEDREKNYPTKIIEVSTAKQLAAFIRLINIDRIDFSGYTIQLQNDISLAGHLWEPLGTGNTGDVYYSTSYIYKKFSGTFDGNEKTISGIYANAVSDTNGISFNALFGYVSGAVIKNLKIEDSYFDGGNYVGSIVGTIGNSDNRTEIIHCISKATLTNCDESAGGIVGQIQDGATLRYCSFWGSISCTGESSTASAIVGRISNLYSSYKDNITIDKCNGFSGTTTTPIITASKVSGIVGHILNQCSVKIGNCVTELSEVVGTIEDLGRDKVAISDCYYKKSNGKYTKDGSEEIDYAEFLTVNVEAPEVHTYGEYYNNNTQHWQKCIDTTCSTAGGAESEKENHTWDSNYKCTTCGYNPTKVNVPTAKSDFTYTGEILTGVATGTGYTLTGSTGTAAGSYTATATLANGYIWSDGTTTAKAITWSIGNADQSAPVESLTGVKPSVKNASDGKITGVTTAMEYQKQDESSWKTCTGNEITGLAAGAYNIRYAAKTNYNASGSISVTVPEGPTPYTLTVTDGSGSGSYVAGKQVTITANTPADGKEFDKWEVTNGNASLANANNSTTTITTAEGNSTVTATYKDKQYTVSYNPDNGTTIADKTMKWAGKVLEGIDAPTKTGYTFAGWKCGETSVGANATYSELAASDSTGITLKATWTECNHESSTAKPTCTDSAICSICGKTLPATGHTYDQNVVKADYLKAAANCQSPSVYYKSCACGEFSKADGAATFEYGEKNANNHIDADNDNKCDRCNKSLITYSGGGAVAPSTTDNVTNKTETTATGTEKVTNAEVSSKTTTKADGSKATTTTVDTKTADKIVEKAVENKSETVVIDAASSTGSTGSSSSSASGQAAAEVAIPAATVTQLSEKTDAAVTIKTDVAEVTLDQKAVAAIAAAVETKESGSTVAATGEVKVIVTTTANTKSAVKLDVKIETANGEVKNLKGGSVSVTVKLNSTLAAKKLACVYIDDCGIYHKVKGQKDANNTFTFKTL